MSVGALVLKMSMSLDGYTSGADGSDWMFRAGTPDSASWVTDTVASAAVHVFGRRTFESIAGFWSTATVPVAEPMNSVRKVVFTRDGFDPRTLDAAEVWRDARVADGDLAAEVSRLKAEHDGVVLAQGGTTFCRNLVHADLVDEYRIVVLPVALGGGDALFAGLPRELDLELVSSTAFAGGAMANVYRPQR
ncbi:dihydrofolate reductase family protein [Curtobacterium sp. RRHDQ66]